IQDWLTAFTMKDKKISLLYSGQLAEQHFNYYKQLFELDNIDEETIINVMTFLHLYMDSHYFLYVTQDIVTELFYHLSINDILSLKQTCSHLNNFYQQIIKNNFFVKNKCLLLLPYYQQLNLLPYD